MAADNLARSAYEAYRNHTGGVSLASGAPIPEWDALPEPIKEAWQASADAIRKQFDWRPIEEAIADEHANRYHRQFVGKWRITGIWCTLATDIQAARAMEYTHYLPQPPAPKNGGSNGR